MEEKKEEMKWTFNGEEDEKRQEGKEEKGKREKKWALTEKET